MDLNWEKEAGALLLNPYPCAHWLMIPTIK